MDVLIPFKGLFALIAAIAAGAVVYFGLGSLSFQNAASRRLRGSTQTTANDLYGQVGQQVLKRSGFSLTTWQLHLKWASLTREVPDLPVFIGKVLLYAIVGIAIWIVMGLAPVGLLAPFALGALPVIQIQSAADKARQQVKRALPEVASLVAAEMAAGSSPEVALERTAHVGGLFAQILTHVMREKHQSSLPLFSSGTVEGALRIELRRWALSELIQFSAILDLIASKGSHGAPMMANFARRSAQSYEAEMKRNTAALDNKMAVLLGIFVMIPFMIGILVPLVAPMLGLFQ